MIYSLREQKTSRSLSPAEKNYSQLDKEALAIVFGVKEIPPMWSTMWTTMVHILPWSTFYHADRSQDP